MSREQYPCNNYQLDLNASSFGACKCGWPKTDHGKPRSQLEWKDKAEHASGLSQQAPPPPPAAAPPPPPPPRPCEFFVADVTASEFGMCTCGFKKADHGAKSIEPPSARVTLAPQGAGVAENVAKPKDDVATVFFASNSAPMTVDLSAQGGPCGNFTLDMSGGFGMCTCGWSKEDHKKVVKEAERNALIEKMIANGTAAKAAAVPAAATSKKPKPCNSYTLDVNAKTFGDCTCGFSKADHQKKEGKFAQDKDEPDEDEIAEMLASLQAYEAPVVRDGVHCCTKFELDVKNPNFDYCLCGFSRKDHQDRRTISHEEYQKIKAKLTKPKEFT